MYFCHTISIFDKLELLGFNFTKFFLIKNTFISIFYQGFLLIISQENKKKNNPVEFYKVNTRQIIIWKSEMNVDMKKVKVVNKFQHVFIYYCDLIRLICLSVFK